MSAEYHIPVLLHQSIESLRIRPDGIYVDCTFGAGGHSRSILDKLGSKGRLIAFDMDDDALLNVPNDKRFILVKSNYRYIRKFLRVHGIQEVDGILADLGVSSHQFDEAPRGFSFRFDADLDMRMNQANEMTALNVINEYGENDLVRVLSEYGEVRNAKTLAKEILIQRRTRPIVTTQQFNQVLDKVMMGLQHKYYAQVYQAIRIEVNQEIESLSEMLVDGMKVLKHDGIFSVISYHSLEDRLVKNLFKSGNLEGELVKDDFGRIIKPFDLINKKPIEADPNEQ
ncbi:MAG TPA: 16S rRNA (cytosine(1402)-N(4))-methyltransferase RsmH, partial [Saprospiraceae bacterium]|nr:16S rRNA (cytosine(1402)-N(4))-methyltransferase RsmH [Saprospiraceae bacterium]